MEAEDDKASEDEDGDNEEDDNASDTEPNVSESRIWFVSGPTDLNVQEWKVHIVPLLQQAIATDTKSEFVLGYAPGTDTKTLEFLLGEQKIPPSNISIFLYPQREWAREKFRKLGLRVIENRYWKSQLDCDEHMI